MNKKHKNSGTFLAKSVLKMMAARYIFAGNFCKDKTILEIGCNNGYGANYLMSKGAKKIVAGDISEEKIEYARLHYKKDGLQYVVLDAQQLQFPSQSFDLIISFETLEHLTKYKDFIDGCHRLLKDGGTFICSTPNKAILSPNSDEPFYPEHVKEFTPDEFRSLVEQDFKQTTMYGFLAVSAVGLPRKFIYKPKPKIYYPIKSIVIRILNPVFGLLFPDQKHLTLEDMKEDEIERLIDKRYEPFPFDSNPACLCQIAVAKKQ